MPLSYDQIETGLVNAQARGLFPGMSVREFSQMANRVTGSREFDAGDVGLLGQMAVGADRVIRGTSEALRQPQLGTCRA